MLDAIDCGPFDGGCVAFAQALAKAHGGEVCVLVGSVGSHPSIAHHAIAKIGNDQYADASGIGSLAAVVESFVKNEITSMGQVFRLDCVRPIDAGDLPNAPAPDALVEVLSKILAPNSSTARRSNKP